MGKGKPASTLELPKLFTHTTFCREPLQQHPHSPHACTQGDPSVLGNTVCSPHSHMRAVVTESFVNADHTLGLGLSCRALTFLHAFDNRKGGHSITAACHHRTHCRACDVLICLQIRCICNAGGCAV
jgi:hypothetical protein